MEGLTVHNPTLSGVSTAGVENVPKEGTYLLRRGEMVITPEQNKTLQEQLNKVAKGHGKAEITSFSINGEQVCQDHADNTDAQT
ncbi:hypothetical protein FPV60_18535 [Acinetobacter colistiniresistens]|uniref:Uncharacterized protein n=1 Tax=Acinetobacter colistiniresistens TaxID=280145 RepID=A0A558EWC9_9GAMM|nr:hypothetical protein FPV60_18535 [Acinetobacter colistiniresistens]